MKHVWATVVCGLSLATGVNGGQETESPETPIPTIRLAPIFGSRTFTLPVQVLPIPANTTTVAIVEQAGRIKSIDTAHRDAKPTTILDITDRVRLKNNEEGLLSMAYHPAAPRNPTLYVWYAAGSPRRTVLSRFTYDPATGLADAASEEVILEVPQPWGNHNGGTVLFGRDGMLYLSIGDGGAANDPKGAGQDLTTLLGTVIRIDIDQPNETMLYSIPSDNPFLETNGARGEIWAYGLRNIWRMAFDSKTGLLWGGDVGQNAFEEVDIITKGGNYGWNLREGAHNFYKSPGDTETVVTIDPVHEYPRGDGQSITGGEVYRGSTIPELEGVYFFADYMTRRIWGIRVTGDEVGGVTHLNDRQPMAVSSFGHDASGELLVLGFESPYTRRGRLYRVTLASALATPSGRSTSR